MRLINFVFKKIRIYFRRKKYKIPPITIISSDCSGGCLLHDYGLPLDTPTVNLIIEGMDFIKFCENLNNYLEEKLSECKTELNTKYPVAYCKDIKIYGLHYHSFQELNDTWERRKKRVHKDNLIFLMTERQLKDEKEYERFMNLNGKKIFLSSVEFAQMHKEAIGLKKYQNMFLFKGITGKRNIESDFNFGEWYINNKE